ncbi:Rpn family recombination-promoting nuclease/putative transposase [Paenibacillus sp. FSL R5-0341]|uniref:Rpn family recombination-promoting nuclease/putative transposase n=1 Tax=Paenibacillus sp. FSL R5-0341 TaxID=2921636 RepID=UPI0030CD4027
MNESGVKKIRDTLEFLSQDREARRLYEERQKYLHDEASMIEWATEKGIAKGLVEGEKRKAIEIAKNMLSFGIEVSIIAETSGLTVSEVEALKD